jgi:2-(1,2-epoxy-1,2-dihydrophenyl)acetyl-CoA isomerase
MDFNAGTFVNQAGTVRVDWQTHDHARLKLTRPAQHNALSIDELAGLSDAAKYLHEKQPKVLSILSESANFSVGGDINAFAQAIAEDTIENWLRTAIGHFNGAISQLRNLDAAIVVGVQGASAGGALGLIWCADHVILSEDASISMAYAKLGGSPDGGTSWLLPRLVNPLRAFEMFTLMSSLKAKQALDWGLANQLVPATEMSQSVDEVVQQWLSLPSQSLKNIKQLLRSAQSQDLETHLLQELEGFISASKQPEFKQRVMKFAKLN